MPKRTMLPIGFNETEIEGFFLISKADAAKAILNLTDKQMKLWLYLNIVDTFADRTKSGETIFHDIPSPADIAMKIGCSERRVVINMKKLEQVGLYRAKIKNWQGYNSTHENAKFASDNLKKGDRLRSKNDQSGAKSDRLRSQNDQSGEKSDRLRSKNDQSGSFLNPEPMPDKDSGTPQTLQTFSDYSNSLSDQEDELTQQSTKVVGEENKEGERENFSAFSEEENSEEEVVSSKLGVMSKNTQNSKLKTQDSEEQDLNSSSSLSKKEQPQIKPKNQSEENKGFGVCSTNELKKQYDNRGFPRLIQKLYEVGLEESQHNEFIDHAIKKMKKLPKFPTYPDDHAMSRFSALMGAYLNREQEQISEERAMELKAAALWREQMELRKQGKLRGE